MCGGDYDGDTAWVCWNPSLVQHVKRNEPEDTSTYVSKESLHEKINFYNNNAVHPHVVMLNYIFNFRYHHIQMGKIDSALSAMIDRLGFDNEYTRQLGEAAFKQVRGDFYS